LAARASRKTPRKGRSGVSPLALALDLKSKRQDAASALLALQRAL
jgi:hypothetical protein